MELCRLQSSKFFFFFFIHKHVTICQFFSFLVALRSDLGITQSLIAQELWKKYVKDFIF